MPYTTTLANLGGRVNISCLALHGPARFPTLLESDLWLRLASPYVPRWLSVKVFVQQSPFPVGQIREVIGFIHLAYASDNWRLVA